MHTPPPAAVLTALLITTACNRPPATAEVGSGTQDSSAEEATDTSSEPICGNGVIEGDELCDDGNPSDVDGCSTVCAPTGHLFFATNFNVVPSDEIRPAGVGFIGDNSVVSATSYLGLGALQWRGSIIEREPLSAEFVWSEVLDLGGDTYLDAMVSDFDGVYAVARIEEGGTVSRRLVVGNAGSGVSDSPISADEQHEWSAQPNVSLVLQDEELRMVAPQLASTATPERVWVGSVNTTTGERTWSGESPDAPSAASHLLAIDGAGLSVIINAGSFSAHAFMPPAAEAEITAWTEDIVNVPAVTVSGSSLVMFRGDSSTNPERLEVTSIDASGAATAMWTWTPESFEILAVGQAIVLPDGDFIVSFSGSTTPGEANLAAVVRLNALSGNAVWVHTFESPTDFAYPGALARSPAGYIAYQGIERDASGMRELVALIGP